MARAKKIPELDYTGNVQVGAQRVLLFRFDEMLNLRETALDFSDIEGVHDMRVASRRLRSALADFLPYLKRRALNRPRRKLKSLASALGEVRDMDVAVDALEKLTKRADADVRKGIEVFINERKLRREQAHAKLTEEIEQDVLQNLRDEFAAGLERAVANQNSQDENNSSDGRESETSFHDAGRCVIEERWRDVRKLSLSLFYPHDSEPLHRMRIAAKKLRYALELFAPAWDDDSLHLFADEASQMQAALGELHDCDVWIDAFGARLKKFEVHHPEMVASVRADGLGQEREAAVWLLQHFVRARTKNYGSALALWREWEKLNFAGRLATQIKQ